MKISIMQPGYLPWLGFFELMINCDIFVLLDDVQYNKKFWRNRNKIRTAHGWAWLSVPVLHKGKRKQLIKDTVVNNTCGWQKKHLNSLKIHYARAEFYKRYIPFFEQLYQQKWELLMDLNVALISYLAKEFAITTPIINSSSLGIENLTGNGRIIEICNRLRANELYDSDGARPFINLELFSTNGIKVIFQTYNHPTYKQVYQPFIPHMSAVDLLFNEGPRSKGIIISGSNPPTI